MSTKLKAGTATSGAVIDADTTGILEIQTGSTPTTAVTIDASQNVGIGTAPSSWGTYKVAQIGGGTADVSVASNNDDTNISTNAYYNAGWKYQSSSTLAERYQQGAGTHRWYYAPSGTAGNAITWSEAMRIDSSGNLLVGTTTQLQSAKLTVNGAVVTNTAGADGGYNASFVTQYIGNTVESNAIMASVGSNTGFRFDVSNGGGSASRTTSFYISKTSCQVVGSLSKGSGSFKIDHPLPQLEETHNLVHSFIEGPQADLIYRGRVTLVDGKASVNIDESATMTEGTFEVLCRDVQCFTTNESDWTPVRGSVSGNILTIESQDATAKSDISWMVIGERKDKHMMDTDWTDENGKVIVEPLKDKALKGVA